MSDSIYLNDFRMAVAESAWDGYVAFREDLTDAEAQQRIKLLHDAHVRKMLAADQLSGDGAVIMTDIPGCDLVLVDAHFPSKNARQCTLFSRTGAQVVIGILARRRYPIHTVH